jgi:hypothetical protein
MVIQNQGCIDRFFEFRGIILPLGLALRREKTGTRLRVVFDFSA